MANQEHNDPLEEFFKKKVREYDIEYKEDDLLKIEGKLDAAETTNNHKRYYKHYSQSAAVILLLSILVHFTY